MTVEIWSDIVCPFCYIGKRQFEMALQQFDKKDDVAVVWRSFQLDPSLVSDPNKSVLQSLMEKKGWSMAQTQQAMSQAVNMAKSVDLDYDFDKAVVANSFEGHRLLHFAKTHGKQNATKESLLKAYFIEGKNTDDRDMLLGIAEQIGLDEQATAAMLKSDDYAEDVKNDIALARQFGISGVPFFVFNRKYAVSGAQGVDAFLQTLQKVE
ncbi:MAG: hypothetical protein RL757_1131 [Bacteroidota bacterium]|jgi:predicted DsbA family dithiol-disulfide isomerase